MPILTATTDSVRPPRPTGGDTSWHLAMKMAVRDFGELLDLLQLPRESARAADMQANSEKNDPIKSPMDFPLFVPRGFIDRMKQGDPEDPLLLQVMPKVDEVINVPGFTADPVGDEASTIGPGILQKYHGRALLVTTSACSVHCRYCFRRHFPYANGPRSMAQWKPALDAIESDRSIHEVILSGGDPLTLVDPLLGQLANHLAKISHLRRLRIHTRLPIMIPERVNSELLDWLTRTRLATIVVVHANHAQEMDAAVVQALRRMINAGVPVLNQAVLLSKVNDTIDAQAELCECLVDMGVMPYYLHLLDRVSGAAHFEVSEQKGRAIINSLRGRLPGYAVPRLVREAPGAFGKVVLA